VSKLYATICTIRHYLAKVNYQDYCSRRGLTSRQRRPISMQEMAMEIRRCTKRPAAGVWRRSSCCFSWEQMRRASMFERYKSWRGCHRQSLTGGAVNKKVEGGEAVYNFRVAQPPIGKIRAPDPGSDLAGTAHWKVRGSLLAG
jgi:hypothetical protein